jgi:hypothetical protein
MTLQASTLRPLPDRERLEAAIAGQRAHVSDLTSYLCHLIPLAEKLGERVYEVAARALADSGVEVEATQLSSLAAELVGLQGQGRYRKARLNHTGMFITYCKGDTGTFSAD